jgi:hypothetical protein
MEMRSLFWTVLKAALEPEIPKWVATQVELHVLLERSMTARPAAVDVGIDPPRT